MFCKWRLHITKCRALLPQGTHTQNLNYQGSIDFSFSPLGLKDPEVENETKPVGHAGNYQTAPLPSYHISPLLRDLSTVQLNTTHTQDFSLSLCLRLCYAWRLEVECMGTLTLRDLLTDGRDRVNTPTFWYYFKHYVFFTDLINKNKNEKLATSIYSSNSKPWSNNVNRVGVVPSPLIFLCLCKLI